jgi:hypothetical protein
MLGVQGPKEIAEVEQLGLELDHQQRSRRGMPAQEIDDPALAELGERHLGPDHPATHRGQPADHELSERCVPGVDDTVDVDRASARAHLDPDLEGAGDRSNRVQRSLTQVPALDPRDGASRYTGSVRQVLLRPVPPNSSHPNEPSKADVVHSAESIDRCAYRGITATRLANPERTKGVAERARGRVRNAAASQALAGKTERAFDMMAASSRPKWLARGQPMSGSWTTARAMSKGGRRRWMRPA